MSNKVKPDVWAAIEYVETAGLVIRRGAKESIYSKDGIYTKYKVSFRKISQYRNFGNS